MDIRFILVIAFVVVLGWAFLVASRSSVKEHITQEENKTFHVLKLRSERHSKTITHKQRPHLWLMTSGLLILLFAFLVTLLHLFFNFSLPPLF